MTTSTARSALWAFALDLAIVVAFAATGRASHREDVWTGLVVTAWPFALALAVGWLATAAWRAPTAPLRSGLGIWAVTVTGGMLLRVASGQGVQIAFVIVAAVVLLLLVGWRALAHLLASVRRRKKNR